MTRERSDAYQRVMTRLADKAMTRLLDGELERLRAAADTLVLATDDEIDVQIAVEDVGAVAAHLVDSGRWDSGESDRMTDLLLACGPAGLALPAVA